MPVKVEASGIELACLEIVGDIAPTVVSKSIALVAQRGIPSFFISPTVVPIGFCANLVPNFLGLLRVFFRGAIFHHP